jgi:hypothetical protein
MPVKRRSVKRREALPDEAADWLNGGGGGTWVYFQSPDELVELWREIGAEIVARHAAAAPGSRPDRWWQHDAPGPRQRIGGIGTPCHERLAHGLRLHRGVPVDWITEALAADFARMSKPLGVPAVDPANPPKYESSATYLDRHGLLLPGERRRLRAADFAPVPLAAIVDFGEGLTRA